MLHKIIVCITLLVFDINTSLADETEAPIVTLPEGQIQGHVLQSPYANKIYYAYQEIPYANPPVGEFRFQEPVAHETWEGVLNTIHNTHSCYLNGREDEIAPDVTQSEDCLYLNVYTPIEPGKSSPSVPVLFWIHGGGFYFGDGTFQVYGPQFLIDHNVVIVTINYRLGAFGFLATADGVIPGNLGLKDQNFALQWVNANIGLFGGDPSKVTIAGESAGGASVGYHLLSKKSEGLFRGAVLQSGTAICSFALQPDPDYYAFKLGVTLDPDYKSEDTADLLELLQKVSAEDINKIVIDVPGDEDQSIWLPVIEDENYDGAFITGHMHDDIKNGKINKVPTLLGYNSEEEIVFIDEESIKDRATLMDVDPSRIVKDKYNIAEEDKAIAGSRLKKLYTDAPFAKDFSAIVKYLTDSDFATPIIQHAELASSYTDVYLYQFSYKGMMGCTNITVEGADTVGHAEDLKYLWHIDRLDDGSLFPVGDRLTQQRLLKLWTNFVKYLNPTPETDPLLEKIIWPKVAADNISYLNINRTLEVKTNPRQYKEFTAIVNEYAKPPLDTY